MNLSTHDNMFTKPSVSEIVGDITEVPSITDFDYLDYLDFGIEELSVSPLLPERCCLRADESPMGLAMSDVSDADLIISAFDSVNFDMYHGKMDEITKDTIRSDTFDSICVADPFGQSPGKGKETSKFDLDNSVSIPELSNRRNGEAEALDKIDEIHQLIHPVLVDTSSQRSAHNNKSNNQNNEFHKTSRSMNITNKYPAVDVSSWRVSRRRSLFSKRARSSVWGSLGNVLPDLDEHSGPDLDLGKERKPIGARGVQRNRSSIMNQDGEKSIGKSCTPAGRISLKVRIGTQVCAVDNFTDSSGAPGKIIPKLLITEKVENKVPRNMVSPCERNLEKITPSDSSVLSKHIGIRHVLENSSYNTSSYHHQIIGQVEGDDLGASTENRGSDPGTSPDSEVINSVPDASPFEETLHMQDSTIITDARVSSGDVSCLSLPHMISKSGKKRDKLHKLGHFSVESKGTVAESTIDAKVPVLGLGQKSAVASCCTDAFLITTVKPYCSNGASANPSCCSSLTDSGTPSATSEVLHSAEMNHSVLVDAEIESLKSQVCETLIPCSSRPKIPKFFGAKVGSKSWSTFMDLASKKDKTSKKKGNKNNSGGKHHLKEADNANVVLKAPESNLVSAMSKDLSGAVNNLQIATCEEREQFVLLSNAWVLCDVCQKWRRIPATLADQIEETNSGWTCKENMDKDFADCSIPQEKSNSEINKELEIFDADDACDTFLASNQNQPKADQESSWLPIKSNLFLQRNHKKQPTDEVMVCHCKPPSSGRLGCGAKCLNRILNIECVKGTCPCGELCSNQKFQKREYARLKCFKSGKKGYGLQALENISEGQFLIEYVGEVLDLHSYEARQREYALNGHKHFYFMTLNGSEVIDACAKGNLGRFINHSCDPNCQTEKWMVNGEVCVGLFAIKDIKKGEEVTFDYNYVRVFGAAAKRCVCGSLHCRGYIGGDPKNSEIIVQGDSENEYPEPVMISEDNELKSDLNDTISNSFNHREKEIANELPEKGYGIKEQFNAVGHLESIMEAHISETLAKKVVCVNSAFADGCRKTSNAAAMIGDKFELDDSVDKNSAAKAVGQLDTKQVTKESLNGSDSAACMVQSEGLQTQLQLSSCLMHTSLQTVGIMKKTTSLVQHEFSLGQETMTNSLSSALGSDSSPAASPSKSLPNAVKSTTKLKYVFGGKNDPAKSKSPLKTHRPSSLTKKGKIKYNVVTGKGTPDVNKLNEAVEKSKKQSELSINHQFEAVEEKLNNLLEPGGGISKRKEASQGYLKLLFLTAASGNSGNGEAIQSNREVSMILDALLKTKSRNVLVDIIDKNGLQMLHNILKQYRKEFIKTPILRKLLKVIEYLAVREILTLEHITGGPPRPGVESLKDSILTLTEHADKQVHQIARNFRDRWLPRSLRRIEFHERVSHDKRSDRGVKPSEASIPSETQMTAGSGTSETSTLDSSASGTKCGPDETKPRKRKSRWDNPDEYQHSRLRTESTGDAKPDIDDDIPPGFSTPCNGPKILSNGSSTAINRQEGNTCIKNPSNIAFDCPQQKFVSRMPISYGIPSSIMQKFGVFQAKTSTGRAVGPGVPFYPFPPLPPVARNGSLSEPAEKVEQGSDTCMTRHFSGEKHTRTRSTDSSEMNVPGSNDWPDYQRGGSHNLGRKFRQQKFSNSKLAPPWVRMRNDR